ncbi:MAG TPA: acyl-CoA thioesterase II [Kineosporiaceae bacterium]
MSDTDTHQIPDAMPDDEDDSWHEGWQHKALAGLLAVLDLQPRPDLGEDVLVGTSQPQPHGRVFGGQVLAQTVLAAQRTVSPERPVHSMHGYFLRAGDSSEPITFTVDRLRDGRSFSARRVQALQSGRPILSMIASFQRPAEGLEHAEPMPDVPPPDAIPPLWEQPDRLHDPRARYLLRHRPLDVRPVQPGLHQEPVEPATEQAIWVRAYGALPDDPAVHAAVLAYASDYSLIEVVLRAQGVSWNRPGLRLASLDHGMWWHRPVRADEWVLYVQTTPSASGARGLGLGRMYRADGTLVASVAQEGMIRVPGPGSRPG